MYDQWGKFIRKIDKKTGLNTNIITSLLVDGSQMYIGSNLGMIKVELPQLNNIKVFKESEGMFNWECRRNGLKKLPRGAILIATTNGLYVYHPAIDHSQNWASAVLSIARFGYGGADKNIFFPSSSDLNYKVPEPIKYSENQVVIKLKGVSQRNPYDVLFHYQLEGYGMPFRKYDGNLFVKITIC